MKNLIQRSIQFNGKSLGIYRNWSLLKNFEDFNSNNSKRQYGKWIFSIIFGIFSSFALVQNKANCL